MGRQGLAATGCIATHYCVMLPGGSVVPLFLNVGIYGICSSFGIGAAVASMVFVCVLAKTNGLRLAGAASSRAEVEGLARRA